MQIYIICLKIILDMITARVMNTTAMMSALLLLSFRKYADDTQKNLYYRKNVLL